MDLLSSRRWGWVEVEAAGPASALVADPALLTDGTGDDQTKADFLYGSADLDEPFTVLAAEVPAFLDSLDAWADSPEARVGVSRLTILSLVTETGDVCECLLIGGDPTQVLTVAEVAAILRISTKMVRELLDEGDRKGDGKIPTFRFGVRTARVLRADLDEWVGAQRTRKTGAATPASEPVAADPADGRSGEKYVYTRRPRAKRAA